MTLVLTIGAALVVIGTVLAHAPQMVPMIVSVLFGLFPLAYLAYDVACYVRSKAPFGDFGGMWGLSKIGSVGVPGLHEGIGICWVECDRLF